MKYATANELGFVPAGGPAEAGLPADWGSEYAIDRWRTETYPVGSLWFIGRVMTIGGEARALQLRGDGLRGATEVRLIFQPTELHVSAYGPSAIIAREGEIIPVPWGSRLQSNATVEVYPVGQAANVNREDSHYANFVTLECSNRRDAIDWQPHATVSFAQTSEYVLPASGAVFSGVPGLQLVPCKGMREGLLSCPVVETSRDIANGYFVSVWSVSPTVFPVLPLAFVLPNTSTPNLHNVRFAIPPSAECLEVHAWKYSAAVTLDPNAFLGAIRLRLTGAPADQRDVSSRGSGVAAAVPSTAYHALCSITRSLGAPASHKIHAMAQCIDGTPNAAAMQLSTFCSVGGQSGFETAVERTTALGNCAAAGTLVAGVDDEPWDAAVLSATCADVGQTCDAVNGLLYSAIGG